MTDDPRPKMEGQSQAIHSDTWDSATVPSGPPTGADFPAKAIGQSTKITSHADSPPQWEDASIVGPFTPGQAVYHGRSQAIHVYGQPVVLTPPPPKPSCRCCAETGSGGGGGGFNCETPSHIMAGGNFDQAHSWSGLHAHGLCFPADAFVQLQTFNGGTTVSSYPDGHSNYYSIDCGGVNDEEQTGNGGFVSFSPPNGTDAVRIVGFVRANGAAADWRIMQGSWGTGVPDGSGALLFAGSSSADGYTAFDITVAVDVEGRVQLWLEVDGIPASSFVEFTSEESLTPTGYFTVGYCTAVGGGGGAAGDCVDDCPDSALDCGPDAGVYGTIDDFNRGPASGENSWNGASGLAATWSSTSPSAPRSIDGQGHLAAPSSHFGSTDTALTFPAGLRLTLPFQLRFEITTHIPGTFTDTEYVLIVLQSASGQHEIDFYLYTNGTSQVIIDGVTVFSGAPFASGTVTFDVQELSGSANGSSGLWRTGGNPVSLPVGTEFAVIDFGARAGAGFDVDNLRAKDGVHWGTLCSTGPSLCCDECEDPNNPGQPLPDFTPGYMPQFRRQIGDPTTSLDSYICTLESAAMVLEWHTRGAVAVWGGELIPYCGKTEFEISGGTGHPGTSLDNARKAWLHWSQILDVRSGQTWSDLIFALQQGRAVILQGDYGVFTNAVKCQDNFEDNHAISVYPYQVGDYLLVGDPLCSDFHGVKISALRAYAEALGVAVFGAASPPSEQKILFAVSRTWSPAA